MPSTWNVARSSRRTRVHHELLICAITPRVELERRVRGVVGRRRVRLPFSSQRSGMCVAPRHITLLHAAEQVVEHVAPVAQHVDDDAAVVFLAVIPRRPLRLLPVALEYPVAELAAHRQDAAEESAVDQHAAASSMPGQPQLVLHDAVAHAGALARGDTGRARRRRSVATGFSRVDVLAGVDRLPDELRAQAGRRRIEVDRVVAIGERRVEVGRPARDAVRARQRLDLRGVAADEDRVGHHAAAVGERNAALRADRADRADEVLVRAHPAGDAVHDDADANRFHSALLVVIRCRRCNYPDRLR